MSGNANSISFTSNTFLYYADNMVKTQVAQPIDIDPVTGELIEDEVDLLPVIPRNHISPEKRKEREDRLNDLRKMFEKITKVTVEPEVIMEYDEQVRFFKEKLEEAKETRKKVYSLLNSKEETSKDKASHNKILQDWAAYYVNSEFATLEANQGIESELPWIGGTAYLIELLEFESENQQIYGTSGEVVSDDELFKKIQELMEQMQKGLMDPLIDATELMSKYYDMLAVIRQAMTEYVSEGEDGKVKIDFIQLYIMFDSLTYHTQGLMLARDLTEAEAQEWIKKFGSGEMESMGGGKYNVRIDNSGINALKESLQAIAKQLVEDGEEGEDGKIDVSQSVYNSFLASIDLFFSREQNKSQKMGTQLDYYNKLITNVQQTISEFKKQMCDVAMNFVRF